MYFGSDYNKYFCWVANFHLSYSFFYGHVMQLPPLRLETNPVKNYLPPSLGLHWNTCLHFLRDNHVLNKVAWIWATDLTIVYITVKCPPDSHPRVHHTPHFRRTRLCCATDCTSLEEKKRKKNVWLIIFKNKSSPGIWMLVEPHSSCRTRNKINTWKFLALLTT